MSLLQRRIAAGRPLRCRHVAKVLQAVLDGEADERTVAAVTDHLDACRDCGLEATVYDEIKASLARSVPAISEGAIERLKAFSVELAAREADD